MFNNTSKGQQDYEADLVTRPLYHDGTPRKPWNKLDDVAKWSWDRLPKTFDQAAYPLP